MLSFLLSCSKDDNIETPIPPKEDLTPIEILAKQLNETKWDTYKVSDDITYKYFHFDNLFTSNQSVSILEVKINSNLKIDIPYVTSGFLKTSDAAINSRANAAINGSFFNTTSGGSTVFLKKDGTVINSTRSGFDAFRENAGFSVDATGKVAVIQKPSGGWHSAAQSTILASGPLLVYDNKLVNQLNADFNTTRHPRTAVGVTSDNRLIAVVVDGRHTEAHGMTTTELSELMNALGCKEAMNLDGGGSSTAWVKNRGVVNYPTDNKKFDHEGERGVATVITFTSNQ